MLVIIVKKQLTICCLKTEEKNQKCQPHKTSQLISIHWDLQVALLAPIFRQANAKTNTESFWDSEACNL